MLIVPALFRAIRYKNGNTYLPVDEASELECVGTVGQNNIGLSQTCNPDGPAVSNFHLILAIQAVQNKSADRELYYDYSNSFVINTYVDTNYMPDVFRHDESGVLLCCLLE